MAQAKPARGSHPHDCNADVLSIQYNTILVLAWLKIAKMVSVDL